MAEAARIHNAYKGYYELLVLQCINIDCFVRAHDCSIRVSRSTIYLAHFPMFPLCNLNFHILYTVINYTKSV